MVGLGVATNTGTTRYPGAYMITAFASDKMTIILTMSSLFSAFSTALSTAWLSQVRFFPIKYARTMVDMAMDVALAKPHQSPIKTVIVKKPAFTRKPMMNAIMASRATDLGSSTVQVTVLL